MDDAWDPRQEDFKSSFNTYDRGPGKNLPQKGEGRLAKLLRMNYFCSVFLALKWSFLTPVCFMYFRITNPSSDEGRIN